MSYNWVLTSHKGANISRAQKYLDICLLRSELHISSDCIAQCGCQNDKEKGASGKVFNKVVMTEEVRVEQRKKRSTNR